MKTLLIFLGASFFLSGCIEVKNKVQDSDPAPLLEPQNISRLETNEPLYFWEGEFLPEARWQSIREKGLSPSKLEYAFEIDEMRLGPEAVLYTNGYNLRIYVNDFKSDEAKLSTFPLGQTAAPLNKGRDGGYILFFPKKAEGFLLVEMRGEIGGQGSPGPDPDKNLAGKDGIDDRLMISGVKIGGLSSWPGKPAEAGKEGYQGGKGLPGGNSGSLVLELKDAENFSFRIKTFAGAGGPGGIGGRGGLGGIHPKVIMSKKLGEPGTRAESGKRGPPGANGESGIKQDFCVKDAREPVCDSGKKTSETKSLARPLIHITGF